MYECPWCGTRSLKLFIERTYEDEGRLDDGELKIFVCQHCGCRVECYMDDEESHEDKT